MSNSVNLFDLKKNSQMDSKQIHDTPVMPSPTLIVPAVMGVLSTVLLFSDRRGVQAAATILASASITYALAHDFHFKNPKEQ